MTCDNLRGIRAVFINNTKVKISDDDILITTMNENRTLLSSGIITVVTGSYSITIPKIWLPRNLPFQRLLQCNLKVVVETRTEVIAQSNSALHGDFSNNYNATDGSFNNLAFSSDYQKFEYIENAA